MKVKELIKKLQNQNQELEVVFGDDEWLEITYVKEDDNNGCQNPVVVIE